jgi:hypothetical protein
MKKSESWKLGGLALLFKRSHGVKLSLHRLPDAAGGHPFDPELPALMKDDSPSVLSQLEPDRTADRDDDRIIDVSGIEAFRISGIGGDYLPVRVWHGGGERPQLVQAPLKGRCGRLVRVQEGCDAQAVAPPDNQQHQQQGRGHQEEAGLNDPPAAGTYSTGQDPLVERTVGRSVSRRHAKR